MQGTEGFKTEQERAAGAASGPVRKTSHGNVSGLERAGVDVFLGVPYGADTGGTNRWLPPKAPSAWSGVKECIEYGPLPPQPTPVMAPMPEESALAQQGPVGEDCLRLNVYTPSSEPESGPRPVMVWFHGGGYFAGSGNGAAYDGSNLAKKQDVVVVSVTHRLGIFGFLYLGDLFGELYADSGNVGMLDCIAALDWVKSNIANFGGDPDQVMCFGQSGGGSKVSTLLGMPAAQGLVHRAACSSGAEFPPPIPQAVAAERAELVVGALGATSAAQLQEMSWDHILNISNSVLPPMIGYTPVVDGRNLPAPAFSPVSALQHDIPLIVSTTETEIASWGAAVEPIDDNILLAQTAQLTGLSNEDAVELIAVFGEAYPGLDNAYIGQLIASQWSYNSFSWGQAMAKAEAGGAPVHFLYFTFQGTNREGRIHSPHTSDIPFFFDSLEASAVSAGPLSPAKQDLADRMSSYWANFARTGDPNGADLPRWEPFTSTGRAMLVAGHTGELSLETDPWAATRDAIDGFRSRAQPGPFGF
ncbi:carboxylesterase/lipase family protein [Streptomyces sp. NPDC090106]|uniref:carboxylesterase/lipase family protein n=1 Tax=Streptomyces sp. NPDC090106 TaxID=3365946 RepID=UPI003802F518